ncbi:MAG: hypothetical protein WD989_01685 [Candidatus Paceibacterota bacterium]
MISESKRAALVKRLKEIQVLQKRKIKLTSGKTADFYIDLKKAYGHPEVLKLICSCMKPYLKNATCVAGSGYGEVSLATALSIKNNLKLSLARDKPRSHGTGAWIKLK